METLQTDFKLYLQTSMWAFLSVTVGIFIATPLLLPRVLAIPGLDMLGAREWNAVLGGLYAILGNFINQTTYGKIL